MISERKIKERNQRKVAIIEGALRVFNELGCLVAVSDSTSEGREIASEIAPNVQVLSTLDQMLQIPVEAVVISTPAETHFSLTEQVLKSGKDVLVEKPFAMNRSESEKLVLMVNFSQLYQQ